MGRLLVTDEEIIQLGERGWVICERQISVRTAELASMDAIRRAREGGFFRPAGTGRGLGHRSSGVRGDEIGWIEPEGEGLGGLTSLVEAFEALRVELNQKANLGLRQMEIQLARYPGDGRAGYPRHRDAFVGPGNRRVSAIVYLNPAWTSQDGGRLRLYSGPNEADFLDVDPLLGRLVLFLSERIEHEVLPCHAERFAATAWYR